ncbi:MULTISPECIES: rod-binding protein [Vibrio]|jgi:flagellar protein FlgJ|uniref:Flagellar protein n=1 Tax=Vibrio campbellii TaxID=680 RepID=A0A2I8XGN0_9VIBR|nr:MULTISPECIES: rod-binding protein [Vibrio]EDL71119.1 putative flagellar protein [Vibrio campbellii HY01]EEZ89175.1 putative flagellar protein [Vibrio harveyi 1DA3]ARV75064.1 flagellar protein [Vibrio campbellii CAIM 519 = NBRC 15631 = ATCC 25920]AUW05578.1 flagellar protein [Vibrio campbellii]AXB33804.1 flagellar protein [Vibrio campbellii]
MKLDTSGDQAQLNTMLYHDNSALASIKKSRDQEGALEVVAGQFEAMFLQMVLRQMRSSSDVLADKDSPFASQQQGVFRDMYDGQLAMELAKKQNSGIANMLIQQLSPSMREVAFDQSRNVSPANDGKVVSLERTSQLENDEIAMKTDAVNPTLQAVASVKQVLGEAGMTTAFTQPLIRKMEL